LHDPLRVLSHDIYLNCVYGIDAPGAERSALPAAGPAFADPHRMLTNLDGVFDLNFDTGHAFNLCDPMLQKQHIAGIVKRSIHLHMTITDGDLDDGRMKPLILQQHIQNLTLNIPIGDQPIRPHAYLIVDVDNP
jgi:hypothetical protein